jgi:hypothetical protein
VNLRDGNRYPTKSFIEQKKVKKNHAFESEHRQLGVIAADVSKKTNLQFKVKFPDPRRHAEKRPAHCSLGLGPDRAGKGGRRRISHK